MGAQVRGAAGGGHVSGEIGLVCGNRRTGVRENNKEAAGSTIVTGAMVHLHTLPAWKKMSKTESGGEVGPNRGLRGPEVLSGYQRRLGEPGTTCFSVYVEKFIQKKGTRNMGAMGETNTVKKKWVSEKRGVKAGQNPSTSNWKAKERNELRQKKARTAGGEVLTKEGGKSPGSGSQEMRN